MSKNKDKIKTLHISVKSTNASQLNHRRTKGTKIKNNDGITKSKQLLKKIKTNRSYANPRVRTAHENEQRLCGNGKPMPSLADLEKMFEDSDDNDTEETKVNIDLNVASPNGNPDTCPTPTEDKLNSPHTIKQIADKMLQIITNLSDPNALLDEAPPLPVIKQKKRKKSGIPYIVGNEFRPQVPNKPSTKFCKGDTQYGIDTKDIDTEEDDYPKQRAKRTKTEKYSKSIFNAKSDEIAATLKAHDHTQSDDSSDSDKTVAYEYYTPINCGRLQSFSPLPSTSKDSETIHKNDIRFNESLVINQTSAEITDNDLEILDQSPKTIVIDESIEVKEVVTDSEVIMIDESNDTLSPMQFKDNCAEIEIIENNISKMDNSTIPEDDYYSSLDFSQPSNNDVIEIIDVDDVIAENKAVIEKYCKSNKTSHLTVVETVSLSNSSEAPSCYNDKNNIAGPAINLIEQEVLSQRDNALDTIRISDTNLNENNETDVRNIFNINCNNTNSVILQCNEQRCNSHKHQKGNMCIFSFLKSMNEIAKTYNVSQVVSSHTPSQTQTNVSQVSKGLGDCPICMESLASVPVASTICGHIFCMRCISAAVRVSGRKCPTCRKALKGKGFHQLFL